MDVETPGKASLLLLCWGNVLEKDTPSAMSRGRVLLVAVSWDGCFSYAWSGGAVISKAGFFLSD
jgi:hypothetical protein